MSKPEATLDLSQCATSLADAAALFAEAAHHLSDAVHAMRDALPPAPPALSKSPAGVATPIEYESSEDNDASSCQFASAPGASAFDRVPSFNRAMHSAHHANYPKHTYIVVEEDFDIIPLIAYLADTHDKTVCYISHCQKVTPYRPILKAVTCRTVIRPANTKKSMKQQIPIFLHSDSGVLLLGGDHAPPAPLKDALVDGMICYGFTSSDQFHTQINLLRATRTFLLLTKAEASLLTDGFVSKHGLEPHPESAQLTAYGPNSPLLPYRGKTKAVLSKIPPQYLKSAYLGKLSLTSKSKAETARRANEFAAKVLLRGNPEDGSKLYPPIGPRLRLTMQEVSKRALDKAVGQGLVLLEEV
ncbi:hypothetical protein RSAG8_08236, partial [Rhizoctonia solani AG-8 WAC10335]